MSSMIDEVSRIKKVPSKIIKHEYFWLGYVAAPSYSKGNMELPENDCTSFLSTISKALKLISTQMIN
jgi:hypothetical protein